MTIENVIANVIAETIGPLVNAFLRFLGFSEVSAEKIVNLLAISVFCIFSIGLLYITFKYS